LYQKLTTLAPVNPHFKSHNREVWREGTHLEDPPAPNFAKIAQGDLSLKDKFLPKI